ncbi:MAG TPA: protein translocase subunit SecF [Polyangiaceae bacterium]|nr:protein translocase subunit SecF [Polyangiaceae bacterium]
MHFFAKHKVYDFMKVRRYFIALSLFITFFSVFLILGKVPGIPPKFGTDFKGGTEIEVAFNSAVEAHEVREAVIRAGFSTPDVVKVEDGKQKNHYLIRVQEVSTLSLETQTEVERALCMTPGQPETECPAALRASEVKFSPGGDKITARFHESPNLDWIRERVGKVKGMRLRPGANNPFIQSERDHKVEIQLMSKGDQLVAGLKQSLGDKAPDQPLRSEWIGPRAGAQLRDSAIKSLAVSIVFIMAYVALRFDLRFAPGGVLALVHDALGMVGILIMLGKEINLTTVASVLTIVGFSVNDTVVIYDRVRENLGKLRGVSFRHLINVSTSEMLGRTLLTNATVQISVLAFFVWGTGTLKEFALSLTVGMVLGTYSSIYVALPVTEWLDRVLFQKLAAGSGKGGGAVDKSAPAAV